MPVVINPVSPSLSSLIHKLLRPLHHSFDYLHKILDVTKMIQIKTDICKLIFCFFFTFNLSEGSQLNLILKINTR